MDNSCYLLTIFLAKHFISDYESVTQEFRIVLCTQIIKKTYENPKRKKLKHYTYLYNYSFKK